MGFLSGEWDDTEFNVLVLKDTGYNIIMMSTFSVFIVPEGQKEERRVVNEGIVKFKYREVVSGSYKYMRAVENHNILRHDGGNKSKIGLDGAWGTTWWLI